MYLLGILVTLMAALTSGEGKIGAGDDPDDVDVVVTADLDTLNNAAGNSDTPYLDSRTRAQRSRDEAIPEKPGDQGVPLSAPPRYRNGAHRGPGELIYFQVNPTDSNYSLTTSNFTLHLKEEVWNRRTGRRSTKIHTIDGNREKSTADGGVADDDTAKQNRDNTVLARPALGPGKFGRWYGRVRFEADGSTVA